MSQKKPILVSNPVQRKEYSYELGAIRLSFSLRVDQKGELKSFKQLLERAIKDIETDLAAMK